MRRRRLEDGDIIPLEVARNKNSLFGFPNCAIGLEKETRGGKTVWVVVALSASMAWWGVAACGDH
jgi:hypothetical protein